MQPMNKLKLLLALGVVLLTALTIVALAGPSESGPPKTPADVEISVLPAPVAPGAKAEVLLILKPRAGIKINRYPKVTLDVPAAGDLVGASEGSLGNDAPPPIGQLDANYFDKTIEPLKLSLDVSSAARSGRHEVEGQLTYYYCVTRSGFCAPKRTPVKIALDVR